MDNSQIENAEKSSRIKKILKYILPIYISIVVLYLLIIISSNFADTSGMFGGFKVIGHILIFGILAMIATGILSIVLTIKFINKNFPQSRSIFPIKVLFNSISAYIIYLSVVNLSSAIMNIFDYVSNDFGFFSVINTFVLTLFYPLVIIPISYKLNKHYKLSRNAAYGIIGVLALLELIKSRPIIGTFIGFIINIHVLLVAIIPAFISSFISNEEVSVDYNKKSYIKEIVILIISIIIFVIITFFPVNAQLNNLFTKIDESRSIPNQKTINNYIYGITPFKTNNNDIYYYAYDAQDCWEFEERGYNPAAVDVSSSTRRNLYYVNKDDLGIISRVSKVHDVYNFNSQTDNIYYNLKLAGPVYELKSDGTIKNIIKSQNPSVHFYHDNYIYYMDYVANGTKKINITNYEITDADELYGIFGGSYVKDDILYYIDFERDIYGGIESGYLGLFNLNTAEIEKKTIAKDYYLLENNRIIGVFEGNLYYAAMDISAGSYLIYQINLETMRVSLIFETDSEFFKYNTHEQKRAAAKRVFENTAIRDNYLYYTNYNDGGKLYRINLTNQVHEKINDDNDSIFFDVIDGYIYYVTNNFNNGKNGFYRIKNTDKEVIIE